MSTSANRRPLHRVAAALAAVTVSGLLGACTSDGDPSTTPTTTQVSLDPSAVQSTASAVLAAAVKAGADTSATGSQARATSFTGAALANAEAAAKVAPALTPEQRGAAELDPATAKVVAISAPAAGQAQVLVAGAQAQSGAPVLVLLTGPSADTLKVAAVTPMLAGAALDAMDPLSTGSAAIPTTGLAATPDAVFADFAASVASPGAKPSTLIAENALTTSLNAAAASETKALASNGVYQRTFTPKETLGGFALPGDKGALVFGQLVRSEAITLRVAGKLTPSKAFTLLTGITTITREARLETNQTIAVVIPTSGKARIIAAREQLVSGTGK